MRILQFSSIGGVVTTPHCVLDFLVFNKSTIFTHTRKYKMSPRQHARTFL